MNNPLNRSFSVTTAVKRSKPLPDRIVIYTPPKWGKTSFAAMFPHPIFLTTRGEDGLQTLISKGQLPETPHFPETACTWNEVLLAVNSLICEQTDRQTFVIDTGNGAHHLAHEQTCVKNFNGDWTDKGFSSFNKGETITARELWAPFLALLDELRAKKNMRIIMCCHSAVQNQKNPAGLDYPKTVPAFTKECLALTNRWADMTLFGEFDTTASKEDPKNKISKVKAYGGEGRILYCRPRGCFDAGNRHGLPEEINMGDSPQEAWANFLQAAQKAKVNPQTVIEGNKQPAAA